MLEQDIIREATRLTRAGRLIEATALLQRMLRGATAPGTTFGTASDTTLARREPPIIDAKASHIEETDRPHSRATPLHLLSEELPGRTKKRGPGLRVGIKRAPPSAPDIKPEGTKFIEGIYSNPAGSRTYKLFIPSRYRGQPLPLIVMLHGCTQSPDDFAAGTRMNFVAEEQTCFVVYPAQPSEANHAKCWNWFRTADQQRGRGEPSLIAGITRRIVRDYSVDLKRVYIGGLSAGAAAAAIMGATYSDLYAAIGIHSGLACGAAIDLPSAFVAMRQGGSVASSGSGDSAIPTGGPTVPTIVFHGDRDITVHPSNADHILEQSARTTSTRKTMYRGRVPGGHAYTRTVHTDASGRGILEHWNIHGAGHAWSGGSSAGSYTDPRGPDATREMLRFFLEHSLPQQPGWS
ncbi:PHB depolymerase family esterase [Bradyrhizobium sp. Tv2a-2]|uniref:extracellular catalytic domain type 1 short-chain-length polyhydroxyalkanoate depolymerase n=1 Tax=Bradyrhizobium sp. Tv2a-2 TaxID=113395 RepID=UPI0004650314|nr:PHB depolymerase family esterase [Bradyrhizobium sp. Tv2a-2]